MVTVPLLLTPPFTEFGDITSDTSVGAPIAKAAVLDTLPIVACKVTIVLAETASVFTTNVAEL